MKKTLITLAIFSLTSLFTLQSCEKDRGSEGFDFSNSLSPYVALSNVTAKTVQQGKATTVTFLMRTALQQAVTVTYDVIGGGVNLANQTALIERNKTNVVATINIPAAIIVAPDTSAITTLTLVKAVTADGKQLTIGQKNTPAAEKVTINITL